jgi:hypothetical protein
MTATDTDTPSDPAAAAEIGFCHHAAYSAWTNRVSGKSHADQQRAVTRPR